MAIFPEAQKLLELAPFIKDVTNVYRCTVSHFLSCLAYFLLENGAFTFTNPSNNAVCQMVKSH